MGKNTSKTLVVFGVGQVGMSVAKEALNQGYRVFGTTRENSSTAKLQAVGIEPVVYGSLSTAALESYITDTTDVVITFPPDGRTDAELAPFLKRAKSCVYISTTSVFGTARSITSTTKVANDVSKLTRLRQVAEQVWMSIGASIVRLSSFYDCTTGIYPLLLSGQYKLPGDGQQIISQIHIEDAARLILRALEQNGQDIYLGVDERPVSRVELVRWLCDRFKLDMPGRAELDQLHPTYYSDRYVDSSDTLKKLSLRLKYPTFVEGYSECDGAEER